MEQKFHGSESSLYGLFAPWNESAEERKGQLPDTVRKALGSETDTGSAQHETENKPMCSGRIVVGKWREKLGV